MSGIVSKWSAFPNTRLDVCKEKEKTEKIRTKEILPASGD